jgi:ABC-2 type transport system permease protein
MIRTLLALLRKEFLQIRRDRLMLRQVIAMPIVQLVILSSAATFEVKRARLWVVDQDQSALSRGLVDHLVASGRFVITGASASMKPANAALLTRDAGIIVHVPSGFERDLRRSGTADIQLVLNAEDGAAAGVTQAYATQIVRRYAAERQAELRPNVRSAPTVDVRARGWYNPELSYRDYMIPGILVQLVTVIGTLLTAMNIVREKEVGTLEQLRVTPLARGTFIAAKLIPLWIIAIMELAIGLIVARLIFDVPIAGSLPLVFFAAAIYLTAALGVGLWISTLVNTQQQAMFITFFIIMVYLLMSGLFTPVRSMPDWAQWLAQLNPLKHFIVIMRAVMLKGAGLADIAREMGILALFGIAMLSLAVRQYGRQTT